MAEIWLGIITKRGGRKMREQKVKVPLNMLLDQTQKEGSFFYAIQTLVEECKLTGSFEHHAKEFVNHLDTADIAVEEALEVFANKVGDSNFNVITDFAEVFDTEAGNEETVRKIFKVLENNL